QVKAIRFVRNSGSHAALAAGLIHCHGDCAINLSADLQDPPELIVPLLEKWGRQPKIVWGVRHKRENDSMAKKFCAQLYYNLMNWMTDVKTPPSGADIFLVDRKVIEAYKQLTEKHTSVFMALAWLGFPQESIQYERRARQHGKSKWTLGKKIKLTIDSLLSFSDVPIRYMSVLGFLVATGGFMYALYVVWRQMSGAIVDTWSPLMVAILVIGGIQMIMLGVVGEYLWRIFDEARKRPRFIIEYTID
ncbi:MAG: glycosyltransferase, partial [Candidatus Omnitrophota bacterium]|nr:glycosyltransferase [Candidatus Omnitrophota bacterium]